jgi:hypothetical protein
VNLRKDHYRVSPRAALVVVAANDVQSHRYGQRGRTTGPERPSVVDRNDYSVEGVAGYLARSTDRSTGVSGTEADRFGLGAMRRFKEPAVVGPSPRASFFVRCLQLPSIYRVHVRRSERSGVGTHAESATDKLDKTLSGGSLGSCVDEERSQLREVM